MPQSDLAKLRTLLESLRSQTEHGDADGVTIPARQFLDGNEDESSIGCNLEEHPGLAAFRTLVDKLEARPDVSAVVVQIQEDMGDEEYPFTDSIVVRTSADPDELRDLAKDLSPDDVFELDEFDDEDMPPAPKGHRWVSIWWD